jgi:hypothetical protein
MISWDREAKSTKPGNDGAKETETVEEAAGAVSRRLSRLRTSEVKE